MELRGFHSEKNQKVVPPSQAKLRPLLLFKMHINGHG